MGGGQVFGFVSTSFVNQGFWMVDFLKFRYPLGNFVSIFGCSCSAGHDRINFLSHLSIEVLLEASDICGGGPVSAGATLQAASWVAGRLSCRVILLCLLDADCFLVRATFTGQILRSNGGLCCHVIRRAR